MNITQVEKLTPNITPYSQTFISKTRYITPKMVQTLVQKHNEHIDTPFFIHDTLLSHLDSDNPIVRQQSKESIKWQLYAIKKLFPNAKLVIHYTPQGYQLYKDNPYVLFENVPEYEESHKLTSKLAYDTAHETNLDLLLEHATNADIIHLNGRSGRATANARHVQVGGRNDEVFRNRQDVLKKILKLNKPKIIE